MREVFALTLLLCGCISTEKSQQILSVYEAKMLAEEDRLPPNFDVRGYLGGGYHYDFITTSPEVRKLLLDAHFNSETESLTPYLSESFRHSIPIAELRSGQKTGKLGFGKRIIARNATIESCTPEEVSGPCTRILGFQFLVADRIEFLDEPVSKRGAPGDQE